MACICTVWVTIVAPRSHGLLTKNSSAKGRVTSREVLVREASKISKAIRTIYIAIGCYWNLMVKILLLKVPHALVTGQRNKAAINWSVGPETSSMMANIHSAGTCYKVSEGKQAEVPVCNAVN